MLLLLLACAASAPVHTDTNTPAPEEVDSAPVEATNPEPETYEVTCEGTETYNEILALGFAPPAPIVVEVWGHYSDWWMEGNEAADPEHRIGHWFSPSVQISENGGLLLYCPYNDFSGIDPSWVGFEIDRYVVYVKPL